MDSDSKHLGTELCRLCLSDESVSCPIFADGSKLNDQIFECTRLKIEQIAEVPSSICEMCKSKLVICSQFIKQCHKTEVKIREIYKEHFDCKQVNPVDESEEIKEIEILACVPGQDEELFETETEEDPDTTGQVIYLEIIDQSNPEQDLILGPPDANASNCNENGNNIGEIEKIVSDTSINSEIILSVEPNTEKLKTISTNRNESDQHIEGNCNKPKNKINSTIKYKKPCPICGVLQQNMKQHMNVHTGVKKHICPICKKAFSQRGNLTCHLNIHTGKKPHKCDQCEEAFGDPTALKMHKIKHSDVPKYQCEVCKRTLKYKHSLQTHMLSHRNERRHACPHCEMAFVTSSALKKHIRTHTGDRPYQCTTCSKAFICAGNLLYHSRNSLCHQDTGKLKKGKKSLSPAKEC